MRTRTMLCPSVPTPQGGHKLKVEGHFFKNFPALRAGRDVPPHFWNRFGAYAYGPNTFCLHFNLQFYIYIYNKKLSLPSVH